MTLSFRLIIFFLFFSAIAKAQYIKKYLLAHSQDVTSNVSETGKVTDEIFLKNKLFLIGEIHGIQKGQDIDLEFLKFLNKKAGVRTYVAEVDFAKAYFLNKYLETGKEQFLDLVFHDWVETHAQWGNSDFVSKIKKIREYNNSVGPNSKIHFEGIDKIHSNSVVAEYFSDMLKRNDLRSLQQAFNPLILSLREKNETRTKVETEALRDSLLQMWKEKVSRKLRGELIFALRNCYEHYSSREEQMFQNFKALYKLHNWEQQKLYGFWGFAHVLGATTNGGKNEFLTLKIKNDRDLHLETSIAAISLLYINCEMMVPKSAGVGTAGSDKNRYTTIPYSHDGPLVMFKEIENLKSITYPQTMTLFDLGAKGSPYLKKAAEIIYSGSIPKSQQIQLDEPDKSIPDYFRYVILVRDSGPTRALIL